MDKVLKPDKLEVEPNMEGSDIIYNYWNRTFQDYIKTLEALKAKEDPNINKMSILINRLSPLVFNKISEATDFAEALVKLEALYIKPKNEIYARHLLASRLQSDTESLDEYKQSLLQLARECSFKSVNAERNKDDYIRDSFISGIRSSAIRQRLLENYSLSFTEAFNQARTLEVAQRQADSYRTKVNVSAAHTDTEATKSESTPQSAEGNSAPNVNQMRKNNPRCYYCDGNKHPRHLCPAKESSCAKCKKMGHWARACKSLKPPQEIKSPNNSANKPVASSVLASVNSVPLKLSKSSMSVYVNGNKTKCLVDSGSTNSFIDLVYAQSLKLKIVPVKETITLASQSTSASTEGIVTVNLNYSNQSFVDMKLAVIRNLCSDVLIGLDILKKHSRIVLELGGSLSELKICNLTALSVEPPPLFQNLDPKVTPIADKSRKYSVTDQEFISTEIARMLREEIIESSRSPWRAQVLVVTQNSGKKRMVVDYSRTINRFTLLDAYPLPRIDELVNKVAKNSFYSTLDLKSAYHQIPIRDSEKIYTAFEANGRLYQFRRIPFGVSNGVSCFQRVIDEIIEKENLRETYAYIDNITIGGSSKEEHDKNLEKFYRVATKYNFTFNHDKSEICVQSLKLLGYEIKFNELKPDPDRLKTLLDLPFPTCLSELKRILGFFSYYSQWIQQYADKIVPLSAYLKAKPGKFSIDLKAREAFVSIKEDIAAAARATIDEDQPFTVETDASAHSIAATLNQGNRPVAFFSRTLTKAERNYPAIEKEACAIVESLKRWRHYLLGRRFSLLTDQRSVSFMFDSKNHGKIKNEKISRWRIELSCFNFDIVYRKGTSNCAADLLSRTYNCAVTAAPEIDKLHVDLCHPGVTRLYHFVRSRNLPYSVEDVKKSVGSCSVCARLKPTFHKSKSLQQLIKSTRPFERLSMDFKGPLPSATRNKYLLTIVDEYSRFPFAFPCSEMSTGTVVNCLNQLFSIFGMPASIHSDRGTSFMSKELRDYLTKRGISSSHSTPYNPEGNGQIERFNGIIWKTIELAASSKGLEIKYWELILQDALHSIRSLLCTSTNDTPHERLFKYQRKSTNGTAVPSWLLSSSRALLKRFVRESKYDPLVDEVELLDTNPSYARIRHADGRESSVSLKHLAPLPDNYTTPESLPQSSDPKVPVYYDDNDDNTVSGSPLVSPSPESATPSPGTGTPPPVTSPELRRSTRSRKPPDRLQYT